MAKIKIKNQPSIRIRKKMRKLGLLPLVALLFLGGCATVAPPRPVWQPVQVVHHEPMLKPEPFFDVREETDLLDADIAVETEIARGPIEYRLICEQQAAFLLNELQAQFDRLVQP